MDMKKAAFLRKMRGFDNRKKIQKSVAPRILGDMLSSVL
jgi:hypothetical protein